MNIFFMADPFCLGIVPTYLKKVWKNVLTKDAEKDGDIENNGEKEGFV